MLTTQDKQASTHATAIVEQLLNCEWLEKLPSQLLEMRVVPMLCKLVKTDMLEEDGLAACAKVCQLLSTILIVACHTPPICSHASVPQGPSHLLQPTH